MSSETSTLTRELERSLGRIEANQERLMDMFKDLERRTRNLETKMWMQSGAFAALMIAWTFFGSYITKAIGG